MSFCYIDRVTRWVYLETLTDKSVKFVTVSKKVYTTESMKASAIPRHDGEKIAYNFKGRDLCGKIKWPHQEYFVLGRVW